MASTLNRCADWLKNLPARIWPLKYRPMLDAWVDIGILQIATAVWREAIWNDCTDYLYLEIRVLRKWGFRVRLYDTAMRRAER